MAISTTPASGELRLALDDILVGENVVRDLDEAHVDNLAQSIAGGLLVPLIVRPVDAGRQAQSEDRSLAHRHCLTTPPIVSDSSR
jgi:hypothetical protein